MLEILTDWARTWAGVDYLRMALGVFLTGVAVKLMDDHLDLEKDRSAGLVNWSERLGRANLPYALMALLIAAALDLRSAASLFFASYAVGMGRDLRERLPTGLRSYQELALSLVTGVAVAGIRAVLLALVLIGAVQLTDDLLDRKEDGRDRSEGVFGRSVMPHGFGLLWVVERSLSLALLLVLALVTDWPRTLMVAVAWGLVSLLGRKKASDMKNEAKRGVMRDGHRPDLRSLPGRGFLGISLGSQAGTRSREGRG